MGTWDEFHVIVAGGVILGLYALWDIRKALGFIMERQDRIESAIQHAMFKSEIGHRDTKDELSAAIGEVTSELREINGRIERVVPDLDTTQPP